MQIRMQSLHLDIRTAQQALDQCQNCIQKLVLPPD